MILILCIITCHKTINLWINNNNAYKIVIVVWHYGAIQISVMGQNPENFELMKENTHRPAFTTDLQYPPYLIRTVEMLSCFSHIELLIYT